MSEFISKEKFVKFGCDYSIEEDETMRLRFNNDLLFYKWVLDNGITEFTGGLKEAYELTWDFHRHLYNRKEAGIATKLELAALEQFETFTSSSLFDDEDDEAGD